MKRFNFHHVNTVLMVARLARLLRLLRLKRVAHGVKPLHGVLAGVLQAAQSMAWVLVLAVLFLYLWALAAVTLLGHGLVFGGTAPWAVAQIFRSVPEAMYSLFKVMCLDLSDMEPLFEVMPISKAFVALFALSSSWATLSVLAAVASENMISCGEAARKKEQASAERLKGERQRAKLEEALGGEQ